MASPKNWSRNRKIEKQKDMEYYWDGKSIPERKGKDFIRISNNNPHHDKYIVRGFYKGKSIGGGFFSGKITNKQRYSSKEDARKAAVKFMRNHNYE